jgi:hypothetical protein
MSRDVAPRSRFQHPSLESGLFLVDLLQSDFFLEGLMMVNHFNNDDHFKGSITSSSELFMKMQCLSGNVDTNCVKIEDLDEDKMRCHILDCLVAIRRVETEKKMELITSIENERHECAKRRIFASSLSIILDELRPTENVHLFFIFLSGSCQTRIRISFWSSIL